MKKRTRNIFIGTIAMLLCLLIAGSVAVMCWEKPIVLEKSALSNAMPDGEDGKRTEGNTEATEATKATEETGSTEPTTSVQKPEAEGNTNTGAGGNDSSAKPNTPEADQPEADKPMGWGVVNVSEKVDDNGLLTESVMIGSEADGAFAVVSKDTQLEPGATELILTVNKILRSDGIEMSKGQVSRSFDVHIAGIAAENTVPITVSLAAAMPTGLKASSIQIYHVENGTPVQMTAVDALTAHNQFTYNADNGDMSVNMATFSEVTAVVAAADPWNGTRDTDWYNTTDTSFTLTTEEQFAGFGAIVGGMADGIEQDSFANKTIMLGEDLDLGSLQGKVWYPIGYFNSTKTYEKVSGGSVSSDVMSFEGVFDGQGYTISNIYQNTWEMFGDYNNGYSGTPNHYKDGMGIFGFVMNGTVKNLTVNNFQSDGEFCTTGCVAAYSAGTSVFENIVITKSNPRAYNVPNGGVVGYAYDEDGQSNVITFQNIKVDSSNKITALWGSWDVACAGVLGRMGNATRVNMTNCDVAAVIDVHNDVCGNYQYYQYRYCGMLIGTAGSNSDPADQIANVTFEKVRVRYGDWADYHYCELVANSKAAYTHDYQFSRLVRIDSLSEIQSGTTWLKAGNYYLVDGDSKTCYHIVKDDNGNLVEHKHADEGEETVNGETVLVENNQIVSIPFKQLYTGYGWGSNPSANGVNVEEYVYSVTYMQDQNVLHVEYVQDNSTKVTVANADIQVEVPEGTSLKGWVNTASEQITEIEAGNKRDYVLYPVFNDIYTVRWIDEDGNVIFTGTAAENTKYGTLGDSPTNPASKYANMEFKHWEVRNTDGTYEEVTPDYVITGDVTFYPYYNYVMGEGRIGLTPHDDDGDGRADYYTVEAVKGLSGELVIPGVVNGVPVTVITDLSDDPLNDKITSVIIEPGVEEIGSNAFAMTYDLKEVTVPSSVTNIGANAFSSDLGSIVIKKVTITYDGTWAQWQAACGGADADTNWDSGLGGGSTVICTDATYKLDAGWLDSDHTWSDWKVQ